MKSYDCIIESRPGSPALTIRARVLVEDLPHVLGRAFYVIGGHLAQRGEEPAGPPFAAFHDVQLPWVDVEAGFPVRTALQGRGEIIASQIAAAAVATCVHLGPHNECGPAYEALQEFVERNGHVVDGPPCEVYIKQPDTRSSSEESPIETRISFPLRSAAGDCAA